MNTVIATIPGASFNSFQPLSEQQHLEHLRPICEFVRQQIYLYQTLWPGSWKPYETELVLPEVDFNVSDTLTTPSASQSAENPVAPMDPSPVSNAEDPIGECPLEHASTATQTITGKSRRRSAHPRLGTRQPYLIPVKPTRQVLKRHNCVPLIPEPPSSRRGLKREDSVTLVDHGTHTSWVKPAIAKRYFQLIPKTQFVSYSSHHSFGTKTPEELQNLLRAVPNPNFQSTAAMAEELGSDDEHASASEPVEDVDVGWPPAADFPGRHTLQTPPRTPTSKGKKRGRVAEEGSDEEDGRRARRLKTAVVESPSPAPRRVL